MRMGMRMGIEFEQETNYETYLLYDDPEYDELLKNSRKPKHVVPVAQIFKVSEIKESILDFEELDGVLERLDPLLVRRQTTVVTKYQNLLYLIDSTSNISGNDNAIMMMERRKELRKLLVEAQPRQSKWYDPTRPGQDELYEALEKVLHQLRIFTVPLIYTLFVILNKSDVPDYCDVIKRPMDLGTITKKMKSFAYNSKSQFIADLDLIHENCFIYNSDPESPFRRHANVLRERWQNLMLTVPDVTINSSILNGNSISVDEEEADGEGDDDGLSAIIEEELDGMSQDDDIPKETTVDTLCPKRSPSMMMDYINSRNGHPEIEFFHQCIPDTHSIRIPTYITHTERDHFDRILFENCEHYQSLRSGTCRLQAPFTEILHPPTLLTVKVAKDILKSLLSWLIFEAGFQVAHRQTLNLLSDILSSLLAKICSAIHLYINYNSTSNQAPMTSDDLVEMVATQFAAGPHIFLKFLAERERGNNRLWRAHKMVEERRRHVQQYHPPFDLNEADGDGESTGAVGEDELDLTSLDLSLDKEWQNGPMKQVIHDPPPTSNLDLLSDEDSEIIINLKRPPTSPPPLTNDHKKSRLP